MKIFPAQIILGIDEAGRGSIVGPAVVVGLVDHGREILTLKDSKGLTPVQRERIYERIQTKRYPFFVEDLTPIEIDQRVSFKEYNLLEAERIVRIIDRAVAVEPRMTHVLIDLISPFPGERFLKIIEGARSRHPTLQISFEARADEKYHPVALASIVAKVRRDQIVQQQIEARRLPLRSGYPSDPMTQAWISQLSEEEAIAHREFLRISWKTIKHSWKQKLL